MFVSALFIVFLTITWLIYIAIPKNWRKAVLLLFSYGFIGYLSVTALAALVTSTLVTYAGAMVIEKKKSKGTTALVIGLFALSLVVIKNIPWAIGVSGINSIPDNHFLRTFVLPVGFSFYAFQAIGYIYDVYLGKENAESNFVTLALYMGFWPKFVSGPIERYSKLKKQIGDLVDAVAWENSRISLAMTNILWGYFLKLVVADRLAMIVDEIHMAPACYDVIWLVGGAILYSFQVYADFAGYTLIAIGCAKLFGIELTQNFASPYCSKNMTEFWRRWHISLSSWLRDYVYIPLGGNRKGKLRKYINTLIVFILCGIWHGNGLSFLVWGMLHGIFSALEGMIGNKGKVVSGTGEVSNKVINGAEGVTNIEKKNGLKRVFSCAITFAAVTFAWIFFRAESLTLACTYIKQMFIGGINPIGAVRFFVDNGGNMIQVAIGVAVIVLVWIIDGLCYKYNMSLPEYLQSHRVQKYIFFYVAIMTIFVFGIYGNGFNPENFIYMQF